LPTPYIFALEDTASLTACRLCNILQSAGKLWHELCSGTSLQSIQQQNAGRADDGLCHASVFLKICPGIQECDHVSCWKKRYNQHETKRFERQFYAE